MPTCGLNLMSAAWLAWGRARSKIRKNNWTIKIERKITVKILGKNLTINFIVIASDRL